MGEVTLRVRGRKTLARDGSWTSSESVFCSGREHSVDITVCKGCVHAHSSPLGDAVCRWSGETARGGMDAPAASAALLRVTLVRADVAGAALLDLAKRTPWRLPIVDADDRFLGFVSPALLEGHHWPWHRVTVIMAHEVAAGSSLVVSETEPLGRVLRIMARRGARWVALVDPSGVLQGVLSDVDALHAVAPARPLP